MAPAFDQRFSIGALAGVTMIAAGAASDATAATTTTQGPSPYFLFVTPFDFFGSDEVIEFEGFDGPGTLEQVLISNVADTAAENGTGNSSIAFTLNGDTNLEFFETDLVTPDPVTFTDIDVLAEFPGFDFTQDFTVQIFLTYVSDDQTEVVAFGPGQGISVTFVSAEVPLPGAAIGLLTGVAALAGVSLFRRREKA